MRTFLALIITWFMVSSVIIIGYTRDISKAITRIESALYCDSCTQSSHHDTIYIHDTIYTRSWTCFQKKK
jgi:hypothetical protein